MTQAPTKVAVITGGANGIGRDTALHLLASAHQVLIVDVNEHNAAQVLAQAAQAGHGQAIHFVRADVSREDEVAGALDEAVSIFGRLDCVFNNAGVGGVYGPIAQTPVAEWDATMAVLLRGVFLGIKHGARIMSAQGSGGSIISTASVAAFSAGSGGHAYSTAKAAIVNLTRSAAVELAAQRIRVNAVAPGPLMTDLFHRGDEVSAKQKILAHQPWPEPGYGIDIARLVGFLASDDARLITGQTIVADGGLLAGGPALFGAPADSPLYRRTGVDRGSTGQ